MRVVSCLFTEHNLWLVALAAVVCVSGSVITFGLYARARERIGLQKYGWTFLTAVAAGSSIWCTHFIAMLAYDVAAPVTFDPAFTILSLLVAIFGCGIGFGLNSLDQDRFSPEFSGVLVGLSAAFMHYTGMVAYHVTGLVEWNVVYVLLSWMFAAFVTALALHHAVRKPHAYSRYMSIGFFVVAIVGLHFTGMAAVEVTPMLAEGEIHNKQEFVAIAMAVAGVGLTVVGMGVASYLIDERTSADTVQRLERMANNDALTGLPNRVHFNEYLERELERATTNGWMIAVVAIDLNHFKEINDLRGHEAGDAALKIIGERLSNLIQPGEFTARVGGDEFTAVKRYHHIDEVYEFTSRLETALFEPLRLPDFDADGGASIGVSLFPRDGEQASVLISNSDLAMYRAKSQTGRTLCFYERQMDEASRERKSLRAELMRAIELNELELYYQVQQVVNTGSVSGYEALLRWHHRERGMISPVQFIPIAEESGAIMEIGEWVLRTACREALTWKDPHKVAVNVSGVQLADANLAEKVHAILIETGLPPSRLELEITETAIVANKVRALHTLRRIRALGVSIAIDDFGAGYSSLDTLRSFPFNKIKLDRSFTMGIEHDVQGKAIVRAVLALGRSLEIPVLAEGVETSEQLSILRSEGCDEAQGYFLGRPAPYSHTEMETVAETTLAMVG